MKAVISTNGSDLIPMTSPLARLLASIVAGPILYFVLIQN